MVNLQELVAYCNERLQVESFEDYCPNGLQVEAGNQVCRLVTGVTASMQLIEAAIEAGADTLLVHHGYFWKNEPAAISGMKGRRISRLIKQNINLVAYHLPLDAHPELGNNRQLALRLGLEEAAPLPVEGGLIWGVELPDPVDPAVFAEQIGSALGREPLHIRGAEEISRLAWCTGGAQGFIERVADLGYDTYITGEVSESTVHVARERGMNFFAAGHHATERYGVQALGRELAEKFSLKHEFLDIWNPV